MAMRKILVIAAREYKAAVRTKSFLIGLLLMPVLLASSAGLQYFVKQQTDIGTKRFAIVDLTPGEKIYPWVKRAADRRNKTGIYDKQTGRQVQAMFDLVEIKPGSDDPAVIDQLRFDLSERVLHGELFGFVEIGPTVAKASPKGDAELKKPAAESGVYIRYQTNHPTYQSFPNWASQVINMAIQFVRSTDAVAVLPDRIKKEVQRQFDQALDPESAIQPLPLQQMGLSKRDPASGRVEDPPLVQVVARFLVPAGLVMLMFLVVMLGSTPAMQAIVEEKSLRIAEVLLGSVRPFDLMLGKLLGLMGVSLTIAAVYLGGAYWMAYRYGFLEFLPLDIIAWFLLFQILALLMYGSLFLAVGASASDIKETQTLVMPIVLLMAAPLMVLQVLIENPNNSLAMGASFFPFVTPMLMMARLSVPPGVPLWQPVVGILLVLATTAVCVYAAGRIFRVGILMQGKGAKFSDLARWVISG
jgi:ABC-2 type transport system permease protein